MAPYDFSRLDRLSSDELQPQLPQFQTPKGPSAGPSGDITRQQAERMGRAGRERYVEQQAGKFPLLGPVLFKPLAQLSNTLASPDMVSGRLIADPINGISKFTNWLGDKIQGREGDTSDAWQIPNQVRNFAPMRSYMGSEVTSADVSGRAVAATLLPTALSHALGYGLLSSGSKVVGGLQALGATRALAVAAKSSPALARTLNIGSAVGKELAINAAALPFLDPQQGTLANIGDAFGVELPGSVNPDDTYGEALKKALAVEGLAAPLAVIGAASLIRPFRRELTAESRGFWNQAFWQEMGDQGLLEQYKYNPNWAVGPQPKPTALLPSGAAPSGSPQLPAATTREAGGALALPLPETPYGSAIERSLSDQTQLRQVQQQRQRLQQAGLLEMGPGGQLELSVGEAVNPEVKTQIRQLQMQRGQLLKQINDLSATGDQVQVQELSKGLDEIDKQVADLTLSGSTDQFLAPPDRQLDLPMPDAADTRPEVDTVLAQLDELDDSQLRDIHSQVWRQAGERRNTEELAATQQQIAALQQRMADIEARQQAGELTARGAKGLLTRAQKELTATEQQLKTIQSRMAKPEPLVGEQLELATVQQPALPLFDAPELPPARWIGPAEETPYRSPADYQQALEGYPRDTLRKMAMPQMSPEVAALVKARTGRRVWQAKKSDIIDAFVELAQRRRQFLALDDAGRQLDAPLTTNMAGVTDAPLLDQNADLSVPGMAQTLDADGNPVSVPMVDYVPRGMDSATRERLKMEVVWAGVRNGEFQAPVTPLPQRPAAPEFFNQANFIDDLLSDESGQLPLLYSLDQATPYEASGKNAAALIDEMRLRFQYTRLDNEAAQAQKDAFMAAHGWDNLPWEEKKRLGILGQGVFAYDKNDLIKNNIDVVRPPTPQFNPELPVTEGVRAPKRPPAAQNDGVMLVNRDGVQATEPIKVGKNKTVEDNAKTAATKAAAKAADTADKEVVKTASTARQELLKRRERLAKQAQGASC